MAAVAPLLVLAALLFCLAASAAYSNSIGFVLKTIGNWLVQATWNGPFGIKIGLYFVGDFILSLDNSIRDALAAGITGTEWAWHKTVHATAVAWNDLSEAVDGVATDTANALGYLVRNKIPLLIGAALGGLPQRVAWLVKQVESLAKPSLPTIEKITKVVEAKPASITEAEWAKIQALVKAEAPSLPVAIPNPWPRIRDLGKEIDDLAAKGIDTVKKVSLSGVVGLVGAAVFSALGLGWLQCSNVQNVGKRLCGLDRALIDALFAGLALFLGTLSLEAFAKDVQNVTLDFEGEIRKFWRADVKGAGTGHQFGTSGF